MKYSIFLIRSLGENRVDTFFIDSYDDEYEFEECSNDIFRGFYRARLNPEYYDVKDEYFIKRYIEIK